MRKLATHQAPFRPLWISHRGFKESAVENTHAAFIAARKLGFCALETDLRITRDGDIVLHHDPDLRRLARRADLIKDLSRTQLEAVSLEGHAGVAAGSKLLFFDEFVQEFAGCSWTFDIKPETGLEVVRKLKAWADAHKATALITAQAKFLFWNRRQELLCREFFPNAGYYAREPECYRAGAACLTGMKWLSGIQSGRTYALTAELFGKPLFTEKMVAPYHTLGARLVAFLPPSEADARAAARAGFDEILTNGSIASPEQ